ncbi:MAG TPA: SDR family oxidoreductase [Methanothrix sp.]|uniref:SDR family oxidoreductase n=1 Tax=Methanothrix sp. TaxID=90426 RepID=UPI002D1B642F|nr:SDR family oxidoreductase [Methanothrix sp.]HON34701.1 SDR family oxidoreductase [Methanothrix sp.]HRU75081.1 SDR family oxidoreductase [Methanothrix sp.]
MIVVTGGAGFIGSHLVERFVDDGHDVLCLDSFDDYYDPGIKRSNVARFMERRNFTLLEGDVRDRSLVKRALEGAECVFHLAAQAGVRASVIDPLKAHEVNTLGTLNILQAALDGGVRKVVYASSSSVYGKVEYLPFDESHPRAPVSPYGLSKLMAEEYCRLFHEIYGLEMVSLRYFTVYGPRMRPDLAISIFARRALQNLPIEIFGTGERTRDFTYIDDVVRANVLAMKCNGGVYNIGSGERISIKSLAERIIRQTNSRSRIVFREDAPGDAQHTWANTDRAGEGLGWRSEVDINTGLRRYLKWLTGCDFGRLDDRADD